MSPTLGQSLCVSAGLEEWFNAVPFVRAKPSRGGLDAVARAIERPCDRRGCCASVSGRLVSASRAFDMGKFRSVLIGMFNSAGHFDHCADDQPADHRDGEGDADAGDLRTGDTRNND